MDYRLSILNFNTEKYCVLHIQNLTYEVKSIAKISKIDTSHTVLHVLTNTCSNLQSTIPGYTYSKIMHTLSSQLEQINME